MVDLEQKVNLGNLAFWAFFAKISDSFWGKIANIEYCDLLLKNSLITPEGKMNMVT